MNSNKKEENILKATCRLFIRDGIKNTTMDEIAGNAAVSKVTIYKYFKDKYTLCERVNKMILSGMASRLESVAASGDALRKKLYDFIDCIAAFADSGEYGLCGELARYGDSIGKQYELFLKTYRCAMLCLIDEGLGHGLMKGGLDREMVFCFIDMGVSYYLQNPEYRNRMNADEGFRRKYLSFCVGSIFADGADFVSET